MGGDLHFLVSAVTIPIVGKLADVYGRRRFFVGGLIVFMVASVLAGTAQGFWWLVVARAVQGLGIGIVIPLSSTPVDTTLTPLQVQYGATRGKP